MSVARPIEADEPETAEGSEENAASISAASLLTKSTLASRTNPGEGEADQETAFLGRSSWLRASWRPIAFGGVVGALGGAVAAVAAVVVYMEFNPPLDHRLGPVAQDLTAIATQVRQMAARLDVIDNEIAQGIDLDATMGEQIAAQSARLDGLRTTLGEAFARQKVVQGVGSPIFGVAAAQLAAAFHAGRPFEAELVNIYALGAEDSRVSGAINRLTGIARAGVPSMDELRRELAALAVAGGILSAAAQQSYYDYGVSLIGQYTGYSLQPYEVEVAKTAVRSAEEMLLKGDAAAALEELSAVGPQLAAQFEPWRDQVRRRLSAESALDELVSVAAHSLRARLQAGADS